MINHRKPKTIPSKPSNSFPLQQINPKSVAVFPDWLTYTALGLAFFSALLSWQMLHLYQNTLSQIPAKENSLKTQSRQSKVLGEIVKNDENSLIADEVKKQLNLPTQEEPTIATVTDPTKLSSQIFFKQAQIGDKVLIFLNSQKAVLFRPSEKKVLTISPLQSINKEK